MFFTKGVLKNVPKFTEKYKVADLRPAILFKKIFLQKCLSLNFEKILKATVFRTPPMTPHLNATVQHSAHLYWIYMNNFEDAHAWWDAKA